MAIIEGTTGDDRIIVPINDDGLSVVRAYTGRDYIEDNNDGPYLNLSLEDGGDTVYGSAVGDAIFLNDATGVGGCELHGRGGLDQFFFSGSHVGDGNLVDGGDEDDTLQVTGRGAFIHLGEGTALIGPAGETIFYTATVISIENLMGSSGHNIFVGTDGENLLSAGAGDDLLSGRGGADSLVAGDGNDTVVGGRGADTIGTGRGEDIIRFDRLVESRPDAPDKVYDFSERDTMDLSRIDADVVHDGNQAFSFIGDADFSGQPGELRFEKKAADLVVSADADGDRSADFAVYLWDAEALTASDFIL